MNSYNIDIYQGDNFSLGITVKDDDGVPLNLSGYSARGSIKENYSSTSGVALDCTVTSAVSGVINIAMASSGTSALKSNQFLYDVEVYSTGATDDVFKVLKGYVNVYPEVTI